MWDQITTDNYLENELVFTLKREFVNQIEKSKSEISEI